MSHGSGNSNLASSNQLSSNSTNTFNKFKPAFFNAVNGMYLKATASAVDGIFPECHALHSDSVYAVASPTAYGIANGVVEKNTGA